MKQSITIHGIQFLVERVNPDPFNTQAISENIDYGYKVTSQTGAEYFKWIRKDGTVYASPLQRKIVDKCLAEINKQ